MVINNELANMSLDEFTPDLEKKWIKAIKPQMDENIYDKIIKFKKLLEKFDDEESSTLLFNKIDEFLKEKLTKEEWVTWKLSEEQNREFFSSKPNLKIIDLIDALLSSNLQLMMKVFSLILENVKLFSLLKTKSRKDYDLSNLF